MKDELHPNKKVKQRIITGSKSNIFYQEFQHSNCTLKVSANGECEESKCCWATAECSTSPFWKVESTCSNMVLHDISKAGITDASKLDFNASCIRRLLLKPKLSTSKRCQEILSISSNRCRTTKEKVTSKISKPAELACQRFETALEFA